MKNQDIKHPRPGGPRKWTEKFFKVKKIGETPPLNTEGFWRKPEKVTRIHIGRPD